MGCIRNEHISISGNFAGLTVRRPRNWIGKDYKILVPYKFKFRDAIGSTTCNCTYCEEHHSPYYGMKWYHMPDCAYVKRFEQNPRLHNLSQFYCKDIRLIATTE